jgi:hypothetical protein
MYNERIRPNGKSALVIQKKVLVALHRVARCLAVGCGLYHQVTYQAVSVGSVALSIEYSNTRPVSFSTVT